MGDRCTVYSNKFQNATYYTVLYNLDLDLNLFHDIIPSDLSAMFDDISGFSICWWKFFCLTQVVERIHTDVKLVEISGINQEKEKFTPKVYSIVLNHYKPCCDKSFLL